MLESEHVDPALVAALNALAADDRLLSASSDVNGRLLAAAREVRTARRRRRVVEVIVVVGTAAILVAGAYRWRVVITNPSRVDTSSNGSVSMSPDERVPDAPGPFVPLPYSTVPSGGAHVVRLTVPRSALWSLGSAVFDWPDTTPSGGVVADVIIGEDGLARGVRFVRAVSDQEGKR